MAFERRQQSDASLGYADLRVFIDIIDQEWEMDGLSDDGALRARPTRANMPARFQNDAQQPARARLSLRAAVLTRVAASRALHSLQLFRRRNPGAVRRSGGRRRRCVCVLHKSRHAAARLGLILTPLSLSLSSPPSRSRRRAGARGRCA